MLVFAAAIGAPELGLWGILLLTIFLIGGFGVRLVVIALVVARGSAWL